MLPPWTAQMEATPLTIPTLPVVHVNVPLLSRAKPIHEAIAAGLGSNFPIPPARLYSRWRPWPRWESKPYHHHAWVVESGCGL